MGQRRSRELYAASAVLGVPPQQMHIVDHPDLQDGMRTSWCIPVAAAYIANLALTINASVMLGFDDRGVSGHPNHCSCSKALLQAHETLTQREGETPSVNTWLLCTTSVLKKYVGPLDSFWITHCKISSSFVDVFRTWTALGCHWSQLVWYRIFYALFSRYMYFNTWTQV